MSIPEVFYREAIDVGRFSNSVANGFIENYVKVIHEAAEQLVKLDIRQKKAGAGVVIAPQTRNRLRAIIAQSKASMDKWNKTATKQIIKELQEYANIQTGFIESELLKVAKSGNIPVNSVAVSQKYATSFIKTDPTKINIFTSKQFTEDDFVKFGQGKFELTARQGAMMTLPNGETVEKAFRGIATKNQDLLARTIRAGVFSGESSNQIARKLIGKLDFNSLKAGGQAKLAAHQIRTVVKTSVNQVQNQASQAVYAANKKIAPKYEYVATLDSKTSDVCKRLDGRKFEYNKGPTPPQHFNCRSTTVPVVDYEGLSKRKGFEDLKQPPVGKVVSRPSATGRVPQGTQYGDWLLTQEKKLQIKTLGSEGKVKIFKKLGEKIGGQSALRKIIRSDGTAIPLETLKKVYGKKNIVAKTIKPKPITAPKVKAPALKDSPMFSTQGVDDWLANNPQAANIQQFIEESLDGMESVGGLTQEHIKKMRLFMKKGKIVNQFNMKYEKTKTLGELRQRFLTGKNLDAFVDSNNTVIKRFEFIDKLDDAKLSTGARNWKRRWNGIGNMRIGSHREEFARNIRILKKGKVLTDADFDDKITSYLFKNASGDSNGYTIMNSGMVHTRLRNGAEKINIYAARAIKKSTAETLENNFKFSKFKGTKYERYRQGLKEGIEEVWSNSHPMDSSIDWFSTFIHEMGHQVHYQAGAGNLGSQFKTLKGMTYPTRYSRKNNFEQFAESFTQYIFNPEGLQQRAPRLYKWVEETLDLAIKNL